MGGQSSTLSSRIRVTAGILMALASMPLAQSAHADAKITKMTAESIQDIANQRRKDIVKSIQLESFYFQTAVGEFKDWCDSLNGGVECQKWPALRSQGIIYHFRPFFEALPTEPRKRLLKLVEDRASVSAIGKKYFEESKNYLKNHMAMQVELNRIFTPLFQRYGIFVPGHALSKDFETVYNKYKSAGVEVKDFDETVQLLFQLKLKQLMTVMYYSSPAEKEGLLLSNAEINKMTRDPITKEIISNAHAFFKTEGHGIFAKATDEHAALQRVYERIAAKAPIAHGVWTKDKAKAKIENLPGTDKLARQGKVLNANAIVGLWEITKGFNSEFLAKILDDNRNNTLADLQQNPDITRVATPADIGRAMDLNFFQPLAMALQQDVYQFYYYKQFLSEMKDPRVEYQFRDFKKESNRRIIANSNALNKLQRQFPGIIDRARFDATVPKHRQKGIDKAKADIQAAKNNASEASGVSQIAEGARKIWQLVRNDVDAKVGLAIDYTKKQKPGTYADLKIAKRHEQMLRVHGYSAFGADVDFMKSSKMKRWAYQNFVGPILSVSGMIGGTMVLLEDTWDLGIQEAYGMDSEQYARAEKSDAGIKALKWTFYGIQAAVGLVVTVGTGGMGAPAMAGARTAAAGLTIRAAASILIKPIIRGGVVLARRSIQPVSTAIGLGGIFAVAQEAYEAQTVGQMDWQRVGTNTLRGASTTLMFMGGMTKLANRMARANFSQASIVKTSAAIDVLESSGDVPTTIDMWRNRKTPLQTFAAALMTFGNFMDAGDSAVTLVYNKSHTGAAGALPGAENFTNHTFEEMGSLRVEKALAALGEPITGRQANVIRNFLPGTGQDMLEERLLKAKMDPRKAKKVASLFGLWKSQVAQ